MCKDIPIEEIDEVIKILQQDSLRYADGSYPDKSWIKNFFNNERGYVVGYYDSNILIGVLTAEELLDGGFMLWYIAFSPNSRGKGKGSVLLEHFEQEAKKRGRSWIFLNATPDSIGFYEKKGFVTSKFSKVFEHYKEI